jgi:hypothetical protein
MAARSDSAINRLKSRNRDPSISPPRHAQSPRASKEVPPPPVRKRNPQKGAPKKNAETRNDPGESVLKSRLKRGRENPDGAKVSDTTENIPNPDDLALSDDDEEIKAELSDEERAERRARRKSRAALFTQQLLCFVMVYLTFLIFGAVVTGYIADEATGEVKPLVLSVSEIAEAAEYKIMQGYYMRARGLYEAALSLDYRLSNNPDDALIIAGDYEKEVLTASKLGIDIGAAKIGAKYVKLQELLYAWTVNDAAVYFSSVSAAIAQNNAEKGDQAVLAREAMYNDFLVISRNTAEYGAALKGVTPGDIYDWSPERYVRETLEGLSPDE